MHDQPIAAVLDYAPQLRLRAARHPVDGKVIAVILAVHALVVFVPAFLGTVIIGALLLIGP